MEALGGRGGIAPTHSRPRHLMGVSGQRHAPAAHEVNYILQISCQLKRLITTDFIAIIIGV
jgi:hypothetical protein